MADSPLILLVEDNIDDEVLALRALRKHQVRSQVVVARDGQEAIDYLSGDQAPPQLILLDLHLPRLSGLEVLQYIRNQPRTRLLPVVVLTTSDQDRDRLESYQLGANSYIRKPIDYRDFSDVVKRLSEYWLGTNLPPPATS
jgi:CheY-like chemotaxis protein